MWTWRGPPDGARLQRLRRHLPGGRSVPLRFGDGGGFGGGVRNGGRSTRRDVVVAPCDAVGWAATGGAGGAGRAGGNSTLGRFVAEADASGPGVRPPNVGRSSPVCGAAGRTPDTVASGASAMRLHPATAAAASTAAAQRAPVNPSRRV